MISRSLSCSFRDCDWCDSLRTSLSISQSGKPSVSCPPPRWINSLKHLLLQSLVLLHERMSHRHPTWSKLFISLVRNPSSFFPTPDRRLVPYSESNSNSFVNSRWILGNHQSSSWSYKSVNLHSFPLTTVIKSQICNEMINSQSQTMSATPEFMEGVLTGTTLTNCPSGNPLPRGVDWNDHFLKLVKVDVRYQQW